MTPALNAPSLNTPNVAALHALYGYLVAARRELWPALRAQPDEVLARPLLSGERFHCIKDLVAHIASVEDSWLHEDILHTQPVWDTIPALRDAENGPIYAGWPLETLLDYWQAVEQRTLAYLANLTPEAAGWAVISDGATYTVQGLLWHVMLHEVRHTAQIALMLRLEGLKPPALDALWFLGTATGKSEATTR